MAQELFSHPRIKLLVVTGGEAVVAQARKVATMRLIAAGAGNPPVVVDETANIARAARSIYDLLGKFTSTRWAPWIPSPIS